MENFEDVLPQMSDGDPIASQEEILYPPKFEKPPQSSNIWIRSITSLALYLALGYYIFKQWEVLLLITAIVLIHELGHFLAMKYFKYSLCIQEKKRSITATVCYYITGRPVAGNYFRDYFLFDRSAGRRTFPAWHPVF